MSAIPSYLSEESKLSFQDGIIDLTQSKVSIKTIVRWIVLGASALIGLWMVSDSKTPCPKGKQQS